MILITGLGNKGKEYNLTRHNIGFEAIDYLAEKHDINISKNQHKALVGTGNIDGKKVMLVKPQTYMNSSGESLLDIVKYYDIPFEKILIIYDDIDLETGKIRLRKKGSAGTHNGMRSVIYHLRSDQLPRLRIGIGKPERGNLVKYVLGKFSDEEIEIMGNTVEKSAKIIELFIQQGIDNAMNKFNCNNVE